MDRVSNGIVFKGVLLAYMGPSPPRTRRYPRAHAPARAVYRVRVVYRVGAGAVYVVQREGGTALSGIAALDSPNKPRHLHSPELTHPAQPVCARALARTSHACPRAHTRHARTRTTRTPARVTRPHARCQLRAT